MDRGLIKGILKMRTESEGWCLANDYINCNRIRTLKRFTTLPQLSLYYTLFEICFCLVKQIR